MSQEFKNQIENIKYEIQKAVNTTADSGIKTEVFNLNNSVSNVATNMQALSTNITGAKEEIKTLQNTVQGMGGQIKDVRGLINDEILYKSHQTQQEFEKYINNVKEELLNSQFRMIVEVIAGILTSPFLAYGVSNTLALCFPEAAGWIRISGLRFSPIFLVLAAIMIIFGFFMLFIFACNLAIFLFVGFLPHYH